MAASSRRARTQPTSSVGGGGAATTRAKTRSSSDPTPINNHTTTTTTTTTNGSIFLTQDGGITLPSFCWLIGMPLLLSGRIWWGVILTLAGLVFAIMTAMDDYILEEDKHEIRYNILDADDVLAELEELETTITTTTSTSKEEEETSSRQQQQSRIQCMACLKALAKKFNNKKQAQTSSDNNSLPLLSQQGAYICLRLYPNDDEIVTGAISLLALVAKNEQVRKRHQYQKDDYGLQLPVACIRKSLQRAQKMVEVVEQDDDDVEEKEEQFAELQRKGCLWLGALADTGNSGGNNGATTSLLATTIVEQDGLQAIIDAANWFRYHDGVVNWALWAMFILCYDATPCKVRLVQLGGIKTVCTSLKNIPDSLEVNRHGIAILFDLLRQQHHDERDAHPKLDPWEIRKVALASGLHDVVKNAMMEFSDSMDIMMMGQEMLIGTGYQGDIPQYQQL